MIRKTLAVFALLFAAAALARGQTHATGTLSASSNDCSASNSCVVLPLQIADGGSARPSSASVLVDIAGIFSGATFQFEGHVAGSSSWRSAAASPTSDPTSFVTSISSAGAWRIYAQGFDQVRVRPSAFSTGSATVNMQSTTSPAAMLGGGSAGGTVNSGASGNGTYYAGSGTAVSDAGSATVKFGAVATGQGSGAAGYVGCNNGTDPTTLIDAALGNGFAFYCPTSIATPYAWQMPTGGNASAGIPHVGAKSSVNGVDVSTVTVGPITSSDVNSTVCSNAACSQNTSGTAAGLSGTPALPNGTTATTQSASDNSTKLATTAYVDGALTPYAKPVYNTAVSNVHAPQSAIPMVTPGANTKYRFSFSYAQNDIGTSCSGTSTIVGVVGFTEPNSNQAQSVALVGFAGSGASLLSTWTIPVALGPTSSYRGITTEFYAKSGVAVTFSLTYTAGTGCSPGPDYSFYPLLEAIP